MGDYKLKGSQGSKGLPTWLSVSYCMSGIKKIEKLPELIWKFWELKRKVLGD